MCKICQRCGAIAEYNAYYGRVTCTQCNWVSEKVSRKEAKRYTFYISVQDASVENSKKLSNDRLVTSKA